VSIIDGLRYRARALLWPARHAREIEREMAMHLELDAAQRAHASSGMMSRTDANRAARRAFGNPTYLREEARRMTALEWLDTVKGDIAFAARTFARAPSFTVLIVATLALGIGANAAIFSALHALLFRPLPFSEPDRLMEVGLTRSGNPNRPASDDVVWSYPKFALLRDEQRVFSDLGLYSADPVTLSGGDGAAERVDGEVVGGRYFETLRVRPIVGRLFAPAELDRAGESPTVVLSEGLWQRRFAADPSAVGRILDVDGKPHTIVGVIPSSFTGLSGRADVWMPIAVEFPGELTQAWDLSFSAIGRLAPGVTVAQAQAAVHTLGARIDAAAPYPAAKEQWGASTRLLDATRVNPLVRRSLLVVSCAVLLTLIIMCANVAGLLLVRAKRREHEIAMRVALGAGQARLVRQLVTESLALSLVGGAFALLVATVGVRLLAALDPAASLRVQNVGGLGVVSFSEVRLDGFTFFVAGALALGTGLLFGLVPAMRVTRVSLAGAAREQHARTSKWRVHRFNGRGALSTVEIALAVVLVTGSGLMLRSLRKLLAVSPGFDATHTLTMRLNLLADSGAMRASTSYYDRLLTSVRGIPGVTNAALTACPPLNGGCNRTGAELLDRRPAPSDDQPIVGVHWVTPGWFSTARVPLLRGRDFSSGDMPGSRRAVIVNQTAARTLWPGQDPIGRPVRVGQGGFGADTGWVVGIVGDVRYRSLDSAAAPDFYLPFAQSPRPAAVLFLRTSGDPDALRAPTERIVRGIDLNVPAFDVRTMDARAGDATAQARFGAILLSAFAAMALLLATLGVYAVISSTVATRMREIGIRVALGATPSRVLWLAVGDGAVVVVVGATLGIAAAFSATRMLRALLFDVAPSDPATLAGTLILLALTAMIAAIAPMRRAGRADPMVVLRRD
jgi:predicted permease